MARRFTAALAVSVLLLIGNTSAHAIGFIDSPSASCRKIRGNECAISWYYLAVNAAPNYVISMRIQLQLGTDDPQTVVHHTQGFFQTSMYLPYDMIGEFPVPCGRPGSSADPMPQPSPAVPIPYGNSYAYTIRARDSANLSSANFGTVVCPAK